MHEAHKEDGFIAELKTRALLHLRFGGHISDKGHLPVGCRGLNIDSVNMGRPHHLFLYMHTQNNVTHIMCINKAHI